MKSSWNSIWCWNGIVIFDGCKSRHWIIIIKLSVLQLFISTKSTKLSVDFFFYFDYFYYKNQNNWPMIQGIWDTSHVVYPQHLWLAVAWFGITTNAFVCFTIFRIFNFVNIIHECGNGIGIKYIIVTHFIRRLLMVAMRLRWWLLFDSDNFAWRRIPHVQCGFKQKFHRNGYQIHSGEIHIQTKRNGLSLNDCFGRHYISKTFVHINIRMISKLFTEIQHPYIRLSLNTEGNPWFNKCCKIK